MKKKFLLISALLISILAITTSSAFANTAMNTIGNVTRDVTSTTGNVLTTGVDAVGNVMDDMANGAKKVGNDVATGMTNMGNNNGSKTGNTGYTTTRTSTNSATWLGMDANMWTWLIMAILGVAIVAMVWFYAKNDNTDKQEQHYSE